jgi:mannose-1-phosphate guanylyltransferase
MRVPENNVKPPGKQSLPGKQTMSRWAVILAGGSGTRLQSLTRRLFGEGHSGEARPKQFCTLFGEDTLLGHTRARISSVVPAERTAYLVVKAHAQYYSEDLAGVPAERILAQPSNRGTTAAVAYGLARIAAINPEAVVGFFPADHYFGDEEAFSRTLDQAYQWVDLNRDSLLLLGAQPEHPEVEYGWIEPGAPIGRSEARSIFRVSRFWEKPSAEVARGLFDRGCVWNTFVMIGRVRSYLEALKQAVPGMFRAFEPFLSRSPECQEDLAGQTYSGLASGDFSKQVLSALPERLAVLRLDNVGWSDLGTPERLLETWSRFGLKPLTVAEDAVAHFA